MSGNRRTRVILQPRDIRLLEELETMRVVNREQAKLVAGFGSTTRANTRLLALTRGGFLKRIFIGRHQAVYLPAKQKAKHDGTPVAGQDAILFCQHQLHINEIYLMVRHRPIPAHGASCSRWTRFAEPISKAFPLIPDAYFEIVTPPGPKAMFLEVDLGTEALPVLRRKLQIYYQLAVSGDFPTLFSQPQFRVLIVTTTPRRVDNIRSMAAHLTDKVFWFSTLPQVSGGGLWSPVWLRPQGNQLHSLL